jgi:nitrogen PTS system EIIA component
MAENESPRLVLSNYFTPKTVELNLKGGQRDEILDELVRRIPEIADQPAAQRTLLRALQEREDLCSTGIGDGVAFPHCRSALVGLVEHPVIVFGRHDEGIPYGAIDGSPARLFFLLVAPNVSLHLQILARLSRMLRNPKFRQALLRAERPEKVCQIIQEAEAAL